MRDTINHLIEQAVSKFPGSVALQERHNTGWTTLSYSALGKAMAEIGTGLISVGLKPGDKIGLFINKGPRWLISDLAILGSGGIDVPRGNDLALDELTYIANHAEVKIAVTDMSPDTIPILKKEAPAIEYIIYSGDKRPPEIKGLITWEEVRIKGKRLLSTGDKTFFDRAKTARENDLATIVYTSGTTGRPKGVMLTHGNIAKNVGSVLKCIPVQPEERFLSLLPPYHMFERTVEYIALSSGATLIFSDPHHFREDLSAQQPNFIAGVPRLWEIFYQGVMDRLKKEKYYKLISLLLTASKNFIKSGRFIYLPLHLLADRLIYKTVRDNLGGKLRVAVSGGGTLPPHLDDFFEMIGVTLLNGYGLTETSPVLTIRRPEANMKGSAGRPIPETEIKILTETEEPVPPGKAGIIWVKGPQVMRGYFKDKEATDKVLKNGWLNTGDLGMLTPQGNLVITGRAKDTIVLLSGENIEPEPIETALSLSPFISQVIIVGQDRKHLGALIVPYRQAIEDYCLGHNIRCSDKEELIEYPEIVQLIKNETDQLHNKKEGTRPWARIIRFKLIPEEWTAQSGLLTFTLKKKRAAIAATFQEEIEDLYR
ncbi:MAG: AMP-binding protein [Thermodesulfobacteriota bacterium]|nr:AMP-binding protein [Thermodesulfobacteriota bacterium]